MGYGFVEFASEEDAEYAIKIMNMIKLYGKPIRVNPVRITFSSPFSSLSPQSRNQQKKKKKAARSNKGLDVGANIFVGNLDPEVDEKLLYDTFSAFGVIITTPKVSLLLDLFFFLISSC